MAGRVSVDVTTFELRTYAILVLLLFHCMNNSLL